MADFYQLHALQMVSTPDVQANLRNVDSILADANLNPTDLVVLPECFACFGGSDKDQLEHAEAIGQGAIQDELGRLALHYQIWLVAGTLPTRTEDPARFAATSLLIDPKGNMQAHYQKLHLFDVSVQDNTRHYQESRYTQAGEQVVVHPTPMGKVGMAVCYDLRFAGLFQAMGEIDILVLPSAFTQKTGEAHWLPLLKARAIEKQCYLVAANQGGQHDNGRQTFGHSCILSPWGDELALIEKGQGLVSANFDPSFITKIRQQMPIVQHNRFRSHLV